MYMYIDNTFIIEANYKHEIKKTHITCSPCNENLNLPVQIKSLNLFFYKYLNKYLYKY